MIKITKIKIIVGKIKNKIVIQGKGLKNGLASKIIIQDNPKQDGIYFKKSGVSTKVDPEILHGNDTTTTMLFGNQMSIICIEHLLSALYGLGVKNAIIELVGGNEIPILGGDSFSFIKKIYFNLGFEPMFVDAISFNENVIVYDDRDSSRYIKLIPIQQKELQIDATVSYEKSNIRSQKLIFDFENKEKYIEEISYAKTSYPFIISSNSDIELLRSSLLGVKIKGKGKNMNVYKKNITKGSYYDDEVVRHKILDFIGDLSTTGVVFTNVKIELNKPGHNLNIKFSRTIKEIIKFHCK
jgi:UDP-3-O-[3-hydroxymyristoyl] N-acetylglucosamine deacetylase